MHAVRQGALSEATIRHRRRGPSGIVISNRQLPEITAEAWEWLEKRNAEQPSLSVRGSDFQG